MNRRIALAAAVLVFLGCGRRSVPTTKAVYMPFQATEDSSLRVQPKLRDDDPEPRYLSFKITKIDEKQKPTDAAPYHVPGGEWTFFDCQAVDDPAVEFTVGIMSKRGDGKVPVAWGEAMLIVKDRAAGDRFVKLFAKAFDGKEPKPLKQPHLPKPLSMSTAVLGEDLQRQPKGGFSGAGGGWTATKWFLEDDEASGELFFNYNLKSKQAEFSEKDSEDTEDLLAVLATALRDGPKPERTPETDPNLTRVGPAIGPPRKLPPKDCWRYSFAPGGQFAVYQDAAKIMALALDKPDAAPTEIARFDRAPLEMRVANANLDLVVLEPVSEIPGREDLNDPAQIWWVDGRKKSRTLLRAPEKGLRLAATPVSPDGRYLVFSQWVEDKSTNRGTKALFIFDREKDKTVVCMTDFEVLSERRWTTTQAGPRLEAVVYRARTGKDEPPALYRIDPATGKMEFQKNGDIRLEEFNSFSPDGKRRFRLEKDRLIVTDLDTGNESTFKIHEDDLRFAYRGNIEWVSPLYLRFSGSRLALINVTTMKMNYFRPATAMKIPPHSCQFSPDFRWVLFKSGVKEDDALYLAPIVMAKGR